MTKELDAYKKQMVDAHKERDALHKEKGVLADQLAVAEKQLTTVNEQLTVANEQLVMVNGQLSSAAGTETVLRKHAHDLAEKYEKRLAVQTDQYENQMAEQTKNHTDEICRLMIKHDEEQADEIRRLKAEFDEQHADGMRRLGAERDEEYERESRRKTDELDATKLSYERKLHRLTDELNAAKASYEREMEELREAMHVLSVRADADKSAAAEQRESIARLTLLLQNKRDFKRALCSSMAELDVVPADQRLVAEPEGASTEDDCGAPSSREPHSLLSSSSSSLSLSRAHVAAAHLPQRPNSTDSSVMYDIVGHVTNVVPPTVQCGFCAVDGSAGCTAHRQQTAFDGHQTCAVVNSTCGSIESVVNDDHDCGHRDVGPVSPSSPVFGCGDVIDDQTAVVDCDESQSADHLRPNPGESDNSSVACDEVYVMNLIEKYSTRSKPMSNRDQ